MFEIIQKIFHKLYYKVLARDHRVDRMIRYRNPKKYWNERGGEQYFEEQEAALDRTQRSEFIAQEIARLNVHTFLEIGCGYGKQLKNISSKKSDVLLTGCDFSHPQLVKAREYCRGIHGLKLAEADAEALPFADNTFDAVLSSAVILHNEYEKAQKIISEMIRVSRKYLIHNEDTDITFSRYGYDMKKTYERMGFKIISVEHIPSAPSPADTQFTIVELPSAATKIPASEIKLQYHREKTVGTGTTK